MMFVGLEYDLNPIPIHNLDLNPTQIQFVQNFRCKSDKIGSVFWIYYSLMIVFLVRSISMGEHVNNKDEHRGKGDAGKEGICRGN